LDPPVIYIERQREPVFFFPRWKQRGGEMTARAVPPAGCRRPGGGGAARELHGGEEHPWPLAARPAAVRGPLATRARRHGGGCAGGAGPPAALAHSERAREVEYDEAKMVRLIAAAVVARGGPATYTGSHGARHGRLWRWRNPVA
jgi:hypothetical protein